MGQNMNFSKKAVIIGAGPHSSVIAEIFLQNKEYEIVGMIDNESKEPVLGIPVIGDDGSLKQIFESGVHYAFIAIGSNRLRERLSRMAANIGFELMNAISPNAHVSEYARLGKGIAVMAGAIVNPRAILGDGVIVNTNASVDHDCRIGAYVHIAPGCSVSGSTQIGAGSFLGTGSRVIDRITIGKNVTVGAGGVVIHDLPDQCTAVGVPAKIIKQ